MLRAVTFDLWQTLILDTPEGLRQARADRVRHGLIVSRLRATAPASCPTVRHSFATHVLESG